MSDNCFDSQGLCTMMVPQLIRIQEEICLKDSEIFVTHDLVLLHKISPAYRQVFDCGASAATVLYRYCIVCHFILFCGGRPQVAEVLSL
jgi:hypothetical protein